MESVGKNLYGNEYSTEMKEIRIMKRGGIRMGRFRLMFERFKVTISVMGILLVGTLIAGLINIFWEAVKNYGSISAYIEDNLFVSLIVIIPIVIGILLFIDHIRYQEVLEDKQKQEKKYAQFRESIEGGYDHGKVYYMILRYENEYRDFLSEEAPEIYKQYIERK